MSEFYVTIIHRPEMVPEYIQKGAEEGKQEDLSRSAVIQESLDIFRTQQQTAHENGLRTTIQMTYASLFNEEAVTLAKEHHQKYGDEIGSTFLGLQCRPFRDKFKSKELAIWLFSMEDKKKIVDEVIGQFYEVFGFYPTSTGSYYMDAEFVNYIKEKYPMIKVAVATCWEEGPKAYWNVNNSWYTLLDGGPWNPWIPSKWPSDCRPIAATPRRARQSAAGLRFQSSIYWSEMNPVQSESRLQPDAEGGPQEPAKA
jgi:hypothetical protein